MEKFSVMKITGIESGYVGLVNGACSFKVGAKVKAYGPVAIREVELHFGNTISYAKNQYKTLIDADFRALLTEWSEFRMPNFRIVSKLLKTPALFDTRSIYTKMVMEVHGFDYFCFGINTTKKSSRPLLDLAI